MRTPYCFKIVDLITDKVITDSSAYDASIERENGVAFLCLNRDNVMVLQFTGEVANDGKRIFDEDVVEVVIDGEKTTDVVHWDSAGWRLGGYEGSLADYRCERVVGNRRELRWPEIGV